MPFQIDTKHLTLFLIFFTFQLNYGQWQQLNGPEGGILRKVIEHNGDLFLGAFEGGLHRSGDGGNSWQLAGNGLPLGSGSFKLVKINNVLYVQTALNDDGLYRSDDDGQTWSAVQIDLNRHFITDFTNNGDVLFASVNNGIFISSDNGLNWSFKPVDVVGNSAYSILFHDNKLYLGTDFIMVSEDEGDTWAEVGFPQRGPNGIRQLMLHNNEVFIANSGKLWSTDDFQNYTQAGFSSVGSITSLQTFGNDIYLTRGTQGYVFSTNDGATWTSVNVQDTEGVVYGIYKNAAKIIVSAQNGLWQSTDAGATWSRNESGIKSQSIYSLNSDNNYIIANLQYEGVIRSPDRGATWENFNSSQFTFGIREVYTINGILVVVTTKNIWRSTDNGQSFSPVYNGNSEQQLSNSVVEGERLVVISKADQILISEDSGQTWSERELQGLEINSILGGVSIDGQKIALASKDHQAILSDDFGLTWRQKAIDENAGYLSDVKFHGNKLFFLNGQRIYESSDFGETWNLPFNIARQSYFHFFFDEDKIYATGQKGIYMGDLDGDHLYSIAANLENVQIRGVQRVDDEMYALTLGYGIWKRNLVNVPSDADNDGIADTEDNCPNTPEGSFVDDQGCISAQLDDDEDGVFNNVDSCPNTPMGLEVNNSGCADSELDSDNDGVTNDIDQCPFGTTPGSIINEFGCEIIPRNSVKILTRTPTCPNEANGVLEISTDLNNVLYRVSITDSNNQQNNYTFTLQSSPLLINNLSSGTYTINITVTNTDFDYSYQANINELEIVNSGKRALDTTKKTVSYQVSGSETYNVSLNGDIRKFRFDSTAPSIIELNVSDSINEVVIRGENECQGKIEDTFSLEDEILVFPTLTSGLVSVSGGLQPTEISIYDVSGQLMSKAKMQVNNENSVYLNDYPSGLYIIHIKTKEGAKVFKVVKK